MTESTDPSATRVLPARRPPIRQATLVRSAIAHTFDTFVHTIGIWWPVDPFSAGGNRTRDITIEPAVGGRVYETWDDSSTVDWGRVLTWERPHEFSMSWTGTPAPTEVRFMFQALGPQLTRVTVEHRGWEALTAEQLGQDCALPGGYDSGAYKVGWARILDRFASTMRQLRETNGE